MNHLPLLIAVLLLLSSACTTDKLVFDAAQRQAEDFLHRRGQAGIDFYASEALILASPALGPDRYREIQEYILTGSKRTLRDPDFYKLEGEEVPALQSSADEVLLLLTDSR
jgi:hypothetical protein